MIYLTKESDCSDNFILENIKICEPLTYSNHSRGVGRMAATLVQTKKRKT